MAVAIDPAVEDDFGSIRHIYAHEVRHGTATYELAVPDAAEMRRRWRSLVEAGYPYLVARVDSTVAGYAYGSAYRAREVYRWTVEDSVYVDVAFRGRGIAHALLQRLIDNCKACGFRQMIAVIGDGTNEASVRLHRSLGFELAGRFPGLGRKHGRWLENVQMMRALGDGDRTDPTHPPLPCAG